MATDIVMPRLSDSMEEGTILKWLKRDGDEVARGDELVEIETDKATMTHEADSAGVLSIVAQEGETLPIGAVIARIGAGVAEPAEDEAPVEEEAPSAEPEEPEAVAEETEVEAVVDEEKPKKRTRRGSRGGPIPQEVEACATVFSPRSSQ